MTRRWCAALGLVLLFGCKGRHEAAPAHSSTPSSHDAHGGAVNPSQSSNPAFAAFTKRFLDGYLEHNPTRATEAGDHRFDARWPELDPQREPAEREWIEAQLREAVAFPTAALDAQQRIDRDVIENVLRSWLFARDELKELEADPVFYTRLVGDGLDPLVTREFAPIEVRMASLRARLEDVPRVVRAAKTRLGKPPRIYTETAIQQNQGLIVLCKQELAEHFARVPAMKASLEEAASLAASSLTDFAAFLEKDLLPRSDGSFRLGRARFEKKLRLEVDDPALDIDQVAAGARALLDKTREEMVQTAIELWPELGKKKPLPPAGTPEERTALLRKVLDKVAEERSDDSTILADAEKWLREATRFVREHDLVTLPPEPCRVIEMPEYRRGVSVAYCDAAGPLEAKQETFYAIAPTPKDWTKSRVDSFYREYNKSMLADLTVHEAMPGHFLQLMHNNRFPSKVRAVFSNGAFVEGWAVYGEWLMAKYGFGGPKVRLMRQKMVLRLAANAILDHGVHAGTFEEKDALDLMMKETFQEEGEAIGKWKRARLSSAQLTTYYYGFTELAKIRAAHEKPGMSERAFHDRLLSFGSPPLRALRVLAAETDAPTSAAPGSASPPAKDPPPHP